MFTKEQLINIGAEKLADVILSLYQNKPDIQKQLNTTFAGFDSDPKKLVVIIKRDIASIKRSTRFVDYRESSSLADKINQIRIHIMEELLPKSPNQAVELLLSLLDNHENTLERVDDSGGEVGNVFVQVCADLGKAYASVRNPVTKDIVKIVFDRFMNSDYSIYDKIILNFKDALGEEGLKELKQKFEKSFNNQKIAYAGERGLKDISDCQDNVDAYIQACSFTGIKISNQNHLEIAKRLIKHGRGKEAIEWLDSMEPSTTHGWLGYSLEEKMELKVQALDLCGNQKEAQSERQKWFGISLSAKVYHEILKNGEASFNQSWKDTAIKTAFEFQDAHTALKFLKEIEEFEQVAKFVFKKIDTVDGKNYYSIRPIADLLCNIDPLAATLLYRKMIEPPLLATKSRYYNWAAKDLATCQSLSSKITNWRGFQNHQLYFVELSDEHKRKRSFWSEYSIALNKQMAKDVKVSSVKRKLSDR